MQTVKNNSTENTNWTVSAMFVYINYERQRSLPMNSDERGVKGRQGRQLVQHYLRASLVEYGRARGKETLSRTETLSKT